MSPADRQNGPDFDAVLSGRDRSVRGRLLRAAGRCVEPFYTAAVGVRNAAFDRAWRRTVRLPRPVISVGNLTTGGTGKTPMVIHLVRELQQLGRRPAVLLRGYRADDAGRSDEAQLLQQSLGSAVPVAADADRAAAAGRLLGEQPEIDTFVLDDGFQHRRVVRDLDLVLIDATNPFGYDHVLPRGLLREPPAGLRRADAVLVTRAEQLPGIAAADELDRQIAAHHGKLSLAWFAHRWRRVVDEQGQTVAEPPGFAEADRPARRPRPAVLACCGLGRPVPFFTEAMRWFQVVGTCRFSDHHPYTAADAAELAEAVRQHNAHALLVSEKDWVKLAHHLPPEHPPIWRPELHLECMKGEDALNQLLRARIGST